MADYCSLVGYDIFRHHVTNISERNLNNRLGKLKNKHENLNNAEYTYLGFTFCVIHFFLFIFLNRI